MSFSELAGAACKPRSAERYSSNKSPSAERPLAVDMHHTIHLPAQPLICLIFIQSYARSIMD